MSCLPARNYFKKSLPANGIYPVYGANGKIGFNDKFNHEEPQLLLGCRGSVGSIHISEAFSWINGNAMVVQPFEDLVTRDYLKYALLGGLTLRRQSPVQRNLRSLESLYQKLEFLFHP